jgi:hypothetical protein
MGKKFKDYESGKLFSPLDFLLHIKSSLSCIYLRSGASQ